MSSDNQTNLVGAYTSLPKNFFDLDTDAQLEFLDRLLSGMSPNEKVRQETASRSSQQIKE